MKNMRKIISILVFGIFFYAEAFAQTLVAKTSRTDLPEGEAFVIKRHLIDGIDWMRIVKEYTEKWGDELDKTERTFQGYQQKALRKIVMASKKRIDFRWYDIN